MAILLEDIIVFQFQSSSENVLHACRHEKLVAILVSGLKKVVFLCSAQNLELLFDPRSCTFDFLHKLLINKEVLRNKT